MAIMGRLCFLYSLRTVLRNNMGFVIQKRSSLQVLELWWKHRKYSSFVPLSNMENLITNSYFDM